MDYILLDKKLSPKDEIEDIETYLKLCSNPASELLHFSKKQTYPKISIVSPVYNSGKYIMRFLRSIKYQNFNSIEVISILFNKF